MEVKKIYFDLDNVLADFDRGIREICNVEPIDQLIVDDDITKPMWDGVRRTPRFYNKLEPTPGALELFNKVYSKYGRNCQILSGIPKPRRCIVNAKEDKILWSQRVLAKDVVVNICHKEEKQFFCKGEGYILIDDLSTSVNDWNARGGTAILHKSCEETMKELERLEVI